VARDVLSEGLAPLVRGHVPIGNPNPLLEELPLPDPHRGPFHRLVAIDTGYGQCEAQLKNEWLV
jgi:hypothetical protein